MPRVIWSLVCSLFLTWAIYEIVNNLKSTEHQNVYYNVGRIVALGQCRDGSCSYQYTDKDGELKYATSDKPVVLDQLVYQECWYEIAKGNRCYVEYKPSKN